MAKGGSEFVARDWKGGRSLVNTDVLWPERDWAESQVLRIQTKLHQWAIDDPDRRFDDLFNLVCDPAVHATTRTAGSGATEGNGRQGWTGCGPTLCSLPKR